MTINDGVWETLMRHALRRTARLLALGLLGTSFVQCGGLDDRALTLAAGNSGLNGNVGGSAGQNASAGGTGSVATTNPNTLRGGMTGAGAASVAGSGPLGGGSGSAGAPMVGGCAAGQRACRGGCIPQDGCCETSECPTGTQCSSNRCSCDDGSKLCNGACIPQNRCCDSKDCPMGATCNAGSCTCPVRTHVCNNACVDDTSPNTCGTSCQPCEAPAGGTPSCDGNQCKGSCPSGQQACAGKCIASNTPCQGSCPSDTHDCGGVCVANTSVNACGSSCSPCSTPTNADASCNGSSCDFACRNGYKKCGTGSIPAADCCGNMDCPSGTTCSAGKCACPSGQKLCNNACIASNACCTDSDCTAGAMGQRGTCGSNKACTYACDTPTYRACGNVCTKPSPDNCCGDQECPATAPICWNYVCNKRAAGADCKAGNECSSNNCVDGHCCESTGCNTCETCGTDGKCQKLTSGTDPGSCEGASTCSSSGCVNRFTRFRFSGGSPIDITAASDNTLWFADSETKGAVKLNPNGDITRTNITNGDPGWLAAGSGNTAVWSPLKGAGLIVAVGKDGKVQRTCDVTDGDDTLAPIGVTMGPDGNLWFIDDGAAGSALNFGKISTSCGGLTRVNYTGYTPTGSIITGPDNNIWFGANDGVGKVTVANGSVTFPGLGGLGANTLAVGSDNNIWFTSRANNAIGKLTTSGNVTRYNLPSASKQPHDIVKGPDGALWFTEFGSARLSRITTGGSLSHYEIPSSLGTQPGSLAVGPDGNIWIVLQNPASILRYTVN